MFSDSSARINDIYAVLILFFVFYTMLFNAKRCSKEELYTDKCIQIQIISCGMIFIIWCYEIIDRFFL